MVRKVGALTLCGKGSSSFVDMLLVPVAGWFYTLELCNHGEKKLLFFAIMERKSY